MKRILLIVVCCLCLCGCNSMQSDFQVSEIKTDVIGKNGISEAWTKLYFKVKNISNYTCNHIKAVVEFKSGNLVVTEELNSLNGISYSEPLGPNEVADLEGTIFKDYDGYTASIKNIYCYDKVSIK